MVWNGQRASDDYIIVDVGWELGNIFVYRSICLRDYGSEEQRLRVQIHGDLNPQTKSQANAASFYTYRVLGRH